MSIQPTMKMDIEQYHDEISDADFTTTASEKNEDITEEEKEQLAKDETRTVRNLRLLVGFVLLCSALAASLLVYFYIHKSEEDEFERRFKDDALKVLTALGATIQGTFTAVDSLVVNIVSFAEATNQTWPFVIVDDFAVRAQKTRSLSKAVLLNMYQVVSDEDRLDWEAFTATNHEWIDEALDIQEADPTFTGPIIRDYPTVDVIHGYGEEDSEFGTNRTGPFLPWWHSYPLIAKYPPYNWDLMSASQSAEDLTIWDNHLVQLNGAYLIAEEDDFELQEENLIEADFYTDFIDPGEEPMEPVSDLLYPILINAASQANFFYEDKEAIAEYEMVGILASSVYWRDFIRDILPNGSDGLIAVFSSSCHPTFTYAIDGPEVTFVGTVDAHDHNYDNMAESFLVSDLAQQSVGQTTYSGVPMDTENCPVTVTIYPSETFQDRFVSNDAGLFAIIVASTFVFTSLIFVLYDWASERRQTVVLTSAIKSNAIVTSLFPSNVRDRMYNADESNQTGTTQFVGRSNKLDTLGSSLKGPPIADLFENTTVIFADLVGFTSWSSKRSPQEVFTLLETLYGAFDKIAARRGVFKIETIGDCYVAVTGLPNPQKNHALIMARFAASCIQEIAQVTEDLEESLGPGTRDLKLRVGLNSGPVTAGVLRGHKSRFQLFGDTVNTAARMESNGKPMQIHVSESTAQAIRATGKENWLVPREDLIEAKGKGKLQTYWLNVAQGAGSVATSMDTLSRDGSSMDGLNRGSRRELGESVNSTIEVEQFNDTVFLKGVETIVEC